MGSVKTSGGGNTIAVIVTEFALSADGKWLTTGNYSVHCADSKERAQGFADAHGGYGFGVCAGNMDEWGQAPVHHTILHWD